MAFARTPRQRYSRHPRGPQPEQQERQQRQGGARTAPAGPAHPSWASCGRGSRGQGGGAAPACPVGWASGSRGGSGPSGGAVSAGLAGRASGRAATATAGVVQRWRPPLPPPHHAGGAPLLPRLQRRKWDEASHKRVWPRPGWGHACQLRPRTSPAGGPNAPPPRHPRHAPPPATSPRPPAIQFHALPFRSPSRSSLYTHMQFIKTSEDRWGAVPSPPRAPRSGQVDVRPDHLHVQTVDRRSACALGQARWTTPLWCWTGM